jgi:gluconokinase
MVVLLMGTTGAGKTTVGKILAARLCWTFLDADDFHPPANIEKMHHGIPLTDADRLPWLEKIHAELLRQRPSGRNIVLACSALKQSYRDLLSSELDVRIVYLRGTYDVMRQRIEFRHGHFAGQGILAGQFADLEEPRNALVLDVSRSPQQLAAEVIASLHLSESPL